MAVLVTGLHLSYGQTPGLITDDCTYTDGDLVSTYNPMDPNEDGYTSVNGTGYTAGQEDDEISWIGIPQITTEPNGDIATGPSCGSTDIVDAPSGGESSYVFFDNSQGSSEFLIYRIRVAKEPSGAFGYSILVDTDGRIGSADANSTSGNPGFEYEIRVSLGNNESGNVFIEDIDGTTTGSLVTSYSQADNFQRSDARFQDASCSGDVKFFDFFIDIADLGLTSSSTVRLAAATSTQPSNGILSNVSDIAGIDDDIIGTLGPDSLQDQDATFIQLIELQSPTPISDLGENGCFKTGTSETPIVLSPILDSNTRINGYVNEPEGAFVTVFVNGDTLGESLVTSTGRWSITFNQGSLRPYDEITAIVADSCELQSAVSAKVNVINDLDSDDDGILDDSDEGNGVDPGGDADGDDIPNYLDTDFPDFVDTSPADGINDAFDPDGDGIPNHFDPDSNGDGVLDFIAAGGDPSDDLNGNGIIDSMEDDDGDGIPNTVDADDPSNSGCTDVLSAGGAYPDGICDSYQPSGIGGGGSANDADGDGIADEYDPDSDGDGLASEVDPDEGGTALSIDDVDNDGLPNHLDGDSDGDGIPDSVESTINDGDSDGIPDYLDTDSDGDGILDYIEAQSSNSPVSPSGNDTDGDGIDDSFDTDNGGIDLSSPANTDGTGLPDYLDTDSDDDGILDSIESNDLNRDGIADTTPSGSDTDGDGLDNTFDPDNGGTLPPLSDTDGDGIPDFRDTDDDGDGTDTVTEGSGFTQGGNPIPDYLYNPDYDNDGVIDSADPDSDNDGILDADEDGGTGYNPTGDEDGDGILNYLDLSEAAYGFETDSNGDGIVDAFDFDQDGIPDFHDLDSDNDGITDIIEAGGVDADFDGTADGADTDGDGLLDVFDSDNGGTLLTIPDFDSDGLSDHFDIDADNDGIVDNVEAQNSISYISPSGNDSDKDGIDDAYDTSSGGTYLTPVNTDGVGNPDYFDLDADEDVINDIIEGHDGDTNGVGDWDSNGNGVVNGAEGTGDADGDGLLDAFDSDNTNYNPVASNSALQDTDGDGTKDFQDTDDDGDGLTTSAEGTGFLQGGGTIPDYLYNPDSDHDGINDDLDADSDNDGIPDLEENGGVIDEQGAGAGESLSPTDDRDGDGIMNYLDLNDSNFTATDTNNDGIVDQFDADLDGIPDFLDLDSDNDGTLDIIEAGGTDADNDGRQDSMLDTDQDGIQDSVDVDQTGGNDIDGDGIDDAYDVTFVALGTDADGDGIEDDFDPDQDGDGLANTVDGDSGGTPLANPDTDSDGVIDIYDLDSDNDGITDLKESGGADTDGDGRADDSTDSDRDGIVDTYDNAPLSASDKDNDGLPNRLDLDSDGDGIADVLEAGGTDSDQNGRLDAFVDTDGDGLNDLIDTDNGGTMLALPDTDNDGLANFLDIDSDGDGILDIREAQSTAGYVAPSDSDTDQDGLDDSYDPDNSGTALVPVNTDGKDVADYLDSDSDNDGISDNIEGNDADNNGVRDTNPSGADDDNDGLDNAFDLDCAPCGSVTGASVARQDLDGDLTPDWRDTDDDGDGINTIDEPLDLNPANGIKDYLEDNVGSCGLQFITTDFNGNADLVESNNGITNPANALGGGDTDDAIFPSIGNFLILDLTDVIPQGQAITVTYRSSKANTATVALTSSAAAASGFGNSVNLSDNNTTYNNTAYTVTTSGGIRYLRFEFTVSSGNADFHLDAVSYQFTQCDPDWDNDGVADVDDNDDDNDGIRDDVEVSAALLGDEDSDGTLNYEDPDYSGFVDLFGDGIDDNSDFDLDGVPNHLDLDSDSDGIVDAMEANGGSLPNNMLDDGRFSIAYVQSNDFDGDGHANVYDASDGGTPLTNPDTDSDSNKDFLDTDADGDGQGDAKEGYDDNGSGDSLDDYVDRAASFETSASNPGYYTTTDSDLDGIPDWLEDNDSDGIPNFLEPSLSFYHDTDGDGLVDLFDYTNFGSASNTPDKDADGLPDYRDTDNVITLPVSLLQFSAKAANDGISLTWETASEINNDYFILNRSVDKVNFSPIATIKGHGTSKEFHSYQYFDLLKTSGTYYYRLDQKDFDGTTVQLQTIRVEYSADEILLQVYPNPTTEFLTVRGNVQLKVSNLHIIDLTGKEIRPQVIYMDTHGLKLNLQNLQNGVYILTLTSGELSWQHRFIKK
ncbi:MAG: T9SS type A sorting domain-containing protein [Marinoscillum sp.]|uniref:T9SS type A sorting domain-containing protein n=1 Tax=Marinoscillum sp. TaxID=2024838 RepID=UPI0032F188C0